MTSVVRVGLRILDEDGHRVDLDPGEADALFATTASLEEATVSACGQCRSRVIAAVALVDLLDGDAGFHTRSGDLIDLADDAPTLHLYVVDLTTHCRHLRWRDPLYAEWLEVIEGEGPRVRP
ncbi:MAG: hypothetical protein QOG50_22 [Actinomycetota bacterium]|nr:hypothetical protein [Actinomycetota bacterium]